MEARSRYNGQNIPIYFWNFYNQNEIDNLTGYSFEYDHPFNASNSLTASWNITNSTTTTGTVASDDAFSSGHVVLSTPTTPEVFWSNVTPQGSGQIFNTFMLRDTVQMGSRWNLIASLYENTYKSTYAICAWGIVAGTANTCVAPTTAQFNAAGLASGSAKSPYMSGWVFNTTSTNHFDERLGVTYRPSPDLSIRASLGSAIAPPYINLLSVLDGNVSPVTGSDTYLQTVNAGTLKPETAFGWDVGADYRMRDGVTFLSADAYLTNLYNAFITQVYDSGITCTSTYSPVCTNEGELFYKSNVNLNNERFEGVELLARRQPATGLGWRLSGALQRGFAYNLPPCFYSSTVSNCAIFNTNLAIVPGQNSSGNALSSTAGVINGFSNQSIPYFSANGELSYRFNNGIYASFGGTLYGKNNSLYEKPFSIAYASLRVPVADSLAIQISGDNIFNTLPGLFPIQGGGVPIPLAAVPTGSPAGTPAFGASFGNVLGPATWRFVLTKRFGATYTGNGRSGSR